MDTDTLVLFEDSLRRFNRERYLSAQPNRLAKDGDGTQHWQEMADLGWFELLNLNCERPELVPLLSIYRSAGEGLWREPIGCALGESAMVVFQMQASQLRQRLWDGLASGQSPLAYAVRERGDAWAWAWGQRHLATTARRADDHYVLDGMKVAVADDPLCAAYLVLAGDPDTGTSAFYLVDREAQGLQISRYPTVEGRRLADMQLSGVRAHRVVGGEATVLAETWGVLLAAAEAVGIMRGANAATAEHLRQRHQFGRPLLNFQVLQHRLVEMLMLEQETAALLLETAENFDTPSQSRSLHRKVLALRAQTSRSLRHVTRDAVQLHGGMGVTQECRASHYYRRALTLESLYGGEDAALQALSTFPA